MKTSVKIGIGLALTGLVVSVYFIVKALTGSGKYYLAINSTPAGASVSINGKIIGVTPITSYKVDQEGYQIKITKPGYNDYITSVTVIQEKTYSIDAVLVPESQTEPESEDVKFSGYLDNAGFHIEVKNNSYDKTPHLGFNKPADNMDFEIIGPVTLLKEIPGGSYPDGSVVAAIPAGDYQTRVASSNGIPIPEIGQSINILIPFDEDNTMFNFSSPRILIERGYISPNWEHGVNIGVINVVWCWGITPTSNKPTTANVPFVANRV